MRLRNVPGSEDIIAASRYVVQDPQKEKAQWNAVFEQEAPIQIEIGMGKGKFITTMAKIHPEINYIGIERYSSVLVRAIQKLTAEDSFLPNLKFLCMDATEITEVFAPGEIDRIYLNFSDPWPKDRHAKRRLPSKEFLARYDLILDTEGTIEFKTDNRELFDFAVEEVTSANWKMNQITYDLHLDDIMNKGNVMTEYEEKFSAKGNPIHKYIISR
ncbi:MAG: tRNA (guanosine(46)-N7)-methyltransferase TrmB [Lachnospiraceae bacterium]